MSETGVKWICPDCKRGFKREVFYIKHKSRSACISEKDSILVNYAQSQSSSQSTSPRQSVLDIQALDKPVITKDHQKLLNWFDSQVLILRQSFIQQLSLLHENGITSEEETKSISECSDS